MLKMIFFIRDCRIEILLIMPFIALGVIYIIKGYLNQRSEDVGKDQMYHVPVIRGEPLPIVSSHDCPDLKLPLHGNVWREPGTRKAKYMCIQGYQMEGTAIRMCTSDGVWTGDAPICKKVVKFITTEPTPQPHALDSCIFNISQKVSPKNEEPSNCDGEMGQPLVNNNCLMVNRACTSCQELLRLTGKVHIGNQAAKIRLTCCLKMKVCQEVDWCNGGEMICKTAYGNPACYKCPRGYTGDRCLEILPPAKVKCTWIDRESTYISSETPDCLESWLHNSHEQCVLQGKNNSSYECKTNQVTEEEFPYCKLK